MNKIKYFLQYIFINILFFFFRILGYKVSSFISAHLFFIVGNFFKSKKITIKNLKLVFKDSGCSEIKKIHKKMWFNYGKIFSEYLFIKKFRHSNEFSKKIIVNNKYILNQIQKDNEQVIFISGHFDNFELMAMQIEKSGVDLATVYRPLNNKFLNPQMEKIRKKYICKKQIEKGIAGTRQLLKLFRKKTSIALMIDQRVSEGINCQFFGHNALTTTIPAQFVKKFNIRVVPVHIERILNNKFIMNISKPIRFNTSESIYDITLRLNKVLETMILKNPDQWIWTHNRWKQ